MARCNSCSAPLAADTNRCVYCGTRNDVDLHGKQEYFIHHQHSGRICPVCDKELQTIALTVHGALYVERCDNCYGLFFDPGELDVFLQNSVSAVYEINLKHIGNINRDRYGKQQKIRYLKCPQCRQLMNRVNYGHRSGVVIDRCRKHGVWLDSGEITHLLEWRKAGGQLLHERYSRQKKLQEKQQQRHQSPEVYSNGYDFESFAGYQSGREDDLLETVAQFIFRLFK